MRRRIYDDPSRPLLRLAMRLNQRVSDVPVARDAAHALVRARKPEVAISAACGQGTPVPFRGDITVASDRVEYYEDLVTAYLQRDQATRDALGRVIAHRDPLTGGPDYRDGGR